MGFVISTTYRALDKFTPILRKMEQANASFAAKQSKAFDNMKGSVLNVKNQLIGLAGGVSAASLFYTGANAVTRYNEAVQSLSAITGVTGKELDLFKQRGMQLADELKMGAVDILKGYELVGSAKPELLKNAEALSQVTKQALILGKAGGLLPEDSINAMVIAMNQFGAGANEASKYADIFTTGQRMGAGSIQYLSQAVVKSGGVMKAFGNSFEDTVSILEGFAQAGVPASEAGTMLAGIMSKLSKVNKREFNPQFTKATDIINNLSKAGLSYNDLLKLTDSEGAKWLIQIMNQNKIVQELTGRLNVQGAALQDAQTKTATFSERIRQLVSKYENLIIKGNESSGTLNVFGKVIGFVTDHLGVVIGTIGIAAAAFGSWYTIMTLARLATASYNIVLGITGALSSSAAIAIGKSSLALKAYNIATAIAQGVTWLFSAALWSTGIPEIVIGIMLLVAGIVLLVKNWKEIVAWVKTSNNVFAKYLRAVIYPYIIAFKLVKSAIMFVIDAFVQLWSWFKQTAAFEAILNIFNAIGGVFSWIGGLFKSAWDWISKIVKIVSGPIMKVLDLFSEATQKELGVNEEKKPVNIQKANNEYVSERHEETVKNQLIGLNITDRTKNKVNVSNPAIMPVTQKTW